MNRYLLGVELAIAIREALGRDRPLWIVRVVRGSVMVEAVRWEPEDDG